MGDDDALKAGAHAKSPARRVHRVKPLRRRSIFGGGAGGGAGDFSTSRVLVAGCTQDKDMAATFLQYCAMCERQISHPSNSILYCSEACRRKDSAKPLSASAMSISSPPASPLAVSTPPMRGAVKSSSSPEYFVTSSRIPTDIHHFKSDLDPTEWKPKLPHRSSGSSEAFRYLSRFHDTMTASANVGAGVGDVADRPLSVCHKSTTSLSTMPSTATTTPSLGNTPTTASTSFDSRYEYDFAFNLRPLPPRQNPMYSYSASASHVKGIDLVTPHIPPPPAPAAEDFWAKKKSIVPGSSLSAKHGDGLGALFAKET
ncbi:hypothetical protein PV08_10109 [Exophiala spinifera]|uniref:Life-span regulatory factor domain-containing protein n=1 Tax=Exophiala spinifera TaxID=91928 RepID=A0A0D2AWD4_9EURO|nr:uncharacterized protein PV08_10109 [Exophiala spinifera]KIW10810.1 hypothetical protein PV08_10109 [Exophiala spinifera]